MCLLTAYSSAYSLTGQHVDSCRWHIARLLGLRDAQGIPRLEEFQWQSGIQYDGIKFVAGGNVATALHQFVLGIDRFGGPLGGVAHHVLKHNYVARLAHGIIRFGGDNQSESLKVGGDAKFTAMVVAD